MEAQGLNCAAAANPRASGPKRRDRPHAPARSGSRCPLPRRNGCKLLQSLHAAATRVCTVQHLCHTVYGPIYLTLASTRCIGLCVGCRKQFVSRLGGCGAGAAASGASDSQAAAARLARSAARHTEEPERREEPISAQPTQPEL